MEVLYRVYLVADLRGDRPRLHRRRRQRGAGQRLGRRRTCGPRRRRSSGSRSASRSSPGCAAVPTAGHWRSSRPRSSTRCWLRSTAARLATGGAAASCGSPRSPARRSARSSATSSSDASRARGSSGSAVWRCSGRCARLRARRRVARLAGAGCGRGRRPGRSGPGRLVGRRPGASARRPRRRRCSASWRRCPCSTGTGSALAGAGVTIAVALIGVGLLGVGGILLEAARRRAALAAELRFSASVSDLRDRRPACAGSSPPSGLAAARGCDCAPGTHPVWRRDWQGLLRWPPVRIVRVPGPDRLPAPSRSRPGSASVVLFVVPGLLLFVAALDLIEPLAQESDHPTRFELLPIEPEALFRRHLAAPAAALTRRSGVRLGGRRCASPAAPSRSSSAPYSRCRPLSSSPPAPRSARPTTRSPT